MQYIFKQSPGCFALFYELNRVCPIRSILRVIYNLLFSVWVLFAPPICKFVKEGGGRRNSHSILS